MTDASHETPSPGVLSWRLAELMAQRNHMTQVELAAALAQDGAHPISRTQVGRLMHGGPTIVSVALIGALCRILQCSPNALFGWVDIPVAEPSLLDRIAQQGRQRGVQRVPALPALPEETPRLSDAERAQIVGPKARALPAHALTRKQK